MIVLVAAGAAAAPGLTIELDPDETHHLRVRRADGDVRVDVRDGRGLVAKGTLRFAGRRTVVEVDIAERVAPPPPLRLAVGAGDRDRFAWMVEKATELGVTDIVPLETERAMTVASRLRAAGVTRLERRALEAVKQCGAAWAPAIHAPLPLATFLSDAPGGARWLADAEGAATPRVDGTVTVIVGPEGGLTDAERAAARAAGYRPVRLGAETLRFETAALAVAAHIAAVRVGGVSPGGVPHG
ncbi:MAG TPA: RsmE family RNA methyltransferase [Gemmatimonadales bacterium]|nr:RsmE family RNA methyltransferase [Gemmatimonadales bacterium]